MASAEEDGKAIILRMRSHIPAATEPESFPHRCAIIWKYTPENDGGMPSSDEKVRTDALEDLLVAQFELPKIAYLMVVTTGNGRREWHWYTNDPSALQRASKAHAHDATLSIEVTVDHDPTWSAYKRRIAELGSALFDLPDLSVEKVGDGEKTSQDRAVVAQLRAAGSDLSKPHPVEFFLYFPSQEKAARAAQSLAGRGFEVEVRQAAKGPEWLAFAKKVMLLTDADIGRVRIELEAVATREGGEYDGWGTPIVH